MVRATRQTVRLAARRLLSRSSTPRDVCLAYPGGRFVIRSAESATASLHLQGDINRRASTAFEKVLAETASRCHRPRDAVARISGRPGRGRVWLGRRCKGGLRTVARYECGALLRIDLPSAASIGCCGARAAIDSIRAAWSRGTVRVSDEPDSGDWLKIRDYLRSMIPVSADEVFRIAMSTSCDAIRGSAGSGVPSWA